LVVAGYLGSLGLTHMTKRLFAASSFIVTALALAVLVNLADAAAQLKCETGPVQRTFGSTPWLVYSCDDGYSVVVISAPGNPAMPFYFMFSRDGAGYHLEGEGTGRRESTAAAFEELKRLSASDVEALVAQTRAKPRQ